MNWFELSVKSRANESVPVSLPTIYYGATIASSARNFEQGLQLSEDSESEYCSGGQALHVTETLYGTILVRPHGTIAPTPGGHIEQFAQLS